MEKDSLVRRRHHHFSPNGRISTLNDHAPHIVATGRESPNDRGARTGTDACDQGKRTGHAVPLDCVRAMARSAMVHVKTKCSKRQNLME